MIRRWFLALASILFLLLVLIVSRRDAVRSPEIAAALLYRAETTQERMPHSGVLVTTTYTAAGPITMEARLARLGPGRVRVEYLSAPMQGVLLVEDGDRSWRFDPAQGTLITENAPAVMDAEARTRHLRLVLRNYVPQLLGRGRVASRPTHRLALISRRHGRVARKLWIDGPTGLALRWEEYEPGGRLVTRTLYRRVEFGPPPAAHVFLSPPAVAQVVRNEVREAPDPLLMQQSGFTGVRPAYVPPGFEFDGCTLGRCACSCGAPVMHLRYTDGVRSISVFESPHTAPVAAAPEVIATAQGRMVRVGYGNGTFVFIGDLDEELLRMARSLP